MKTYLYLIFIIFSFCVDADEMELWPSYFEFKTTLQDLNVRNETEYNQFFITEGREMGFPPLNQIPKIYADEWKGWDDLFEHVHNNPQNSKDTSLNSGTGSITYRSFITLMRIEGIDNSENYRNWYNEENRELFKVPKYPEEVYPELKNWKENIQERKGGSQENKEEPLERKEGPQESPSQSVQKNQIQKVRTINKKWEGNHKKRVKSPRQKRQYPSYTEVQQKAKALGIKSASEYRKRYKEIPNAPAHPEQVYEEWENWRVFLGTRPQQYPPYTKLQQKVQALGIKSSSEYKKRYKEIPNAPINPDQVYEEWTNWYDFLGTSPQKKKQILPYTKLQQKVQALGIKSLSEYNKRYKEIPFAPSRPDLVYEEWTNWYDFLGTSPRKFLPYTKLQKKAQALGIKNRYEYRSRYKEIPNAPSNPDLVYEEWTNWYDFLGTSPQKKKQFLPYTKLQQKAQALGIKSSSEYKKRYKEIPNAPAHPEQIYEEWEGWRVFFQRNHVRNSSG